MKKLLIIDPQVSFCHEDGSLYVQGALADTIRLARLITEKASLFSSIDITLDMHQRNDIGHSIFWVDKDGKHPNPFTQITSSDMNRGLFAASNKKETEIAFAYLMHLEKSGGFTHTVWPEHCVAGTDGANIAIILQVALEEWSKKTGLTHQTHIKGMDRFSEHYGIFQAEGPHADFNHRLIHDLFKKDTEVYVAGQAKSHCVATSLKQVMREYPQFVSQITLIEDTTSNVSGFENIADDIYVKLREHGMKTTTTEELKTLVAETA